ncbi:MAG: hydroxymethylbilane synthase [Desulfobacteraceae bacterium]|nr:MAG: hydroxymethylbilane synthase [Desulfobacteraceae bacterium]
MKSKLRLGTRGSRLALWQAEWIKAALIRIQPDLAIDLIKIKTQGDKIIDVPLAKAGGKGLFIKEIEEALMEERIDLAVHSMKDMPAQVPAGLAIGAVPQRENPLDVLVCAPYASLDELPHGARVGTSSLRRASQILYLRPDLVIVSIRGNLDTRLRKLDETDLDALVLAAAGIRRLGQSERISTYLDETQMVPAVGQGALCVEIRAGDSEVQDLVAHLDHDDTRTAISAERGFLKRLDGGCHVPLAAHARRNDDQLHITGLVAEPDGSRMLKMSMQGSVQQAEALGRRLAEDLLSQGAAEILERLQHGR